MRVSGACGLALGAHCGGGGTLTSTLALSLALPQPHCSLSLRPPGTPSSHYSPPFHSNQVCVHSREKRGVSRRTNTDKTSIQLWSSLWAPGFNTQLGEFYSCAEFFILKKKRPSGEKTGAVWFKSLQHINVHKSPH